MQSDSGQITHNTLRMLVDRVNKSRTTSEEEYFEQIALAFVGAMVNHRIRIGLKPLALSERKRLLSRKLKAKKIGGGK